MLPGDREHVNDAGSHVAVPLIRGHRIRVSQEQRRGDRPFIRVHAFIDAALPPVLHR